MPISKPDYQLALPLDLPPAEDDGFITPEEASLRLEQAREFFERRDDKPEWYAEYEALTRGGWPFRVALYIAWAASPRKNRKPDNLGDLATLMGLKSPRAIHTWKARNPAIEQQIALMQAAPLFQHRADLFQAALKVALSEDYKGHNDRKMLFEMLGDYVRRSEIKGNLGKARTITEMSDDELAALLAAGQDQEDSDVPDNE